MTWTVYVALAGWIPFTLVLFAILTPGRAALAGVIFGHLLLPQAAIDLPGILDLSKPNVVGLGVLLGVAFFDPGRLSTLRLRWFDLSALAWILSPLASALNNGLGIFDGMSGSLRELLSTGAPYLAGRLYLRNGGELRDCANMLVLSGLVYAPLCWIEVRFSPLLHSFFYGFHQHQFLQTRRFGGWRPTVFLEHGLAVGIYMASCAALGFGLWQHGKLSRRFGLPPLAILALLVVTAVACKSTGAVALLVLALVALWRWQRSKRPLLLAALVMTAPVYLVTRLATDLTPGPLVDVLEEVSPDRAASLKLRMDVEFQIRDRALERPLLGWGGWGRFREGLEVVATDSLWSITLGQRGLIGLAGLMGLLLIGQFRVVRSLKRLHPSSPDGALLSSLAVVLAMYTLDCMVNAQVNPVYFLIAGGLIAYRGRSSLRSAQVVRAPPLREGAR